MSLKFNLKSLALLLSIFALTMFVDIKQSLAQDVCTFVRFLGEGDEGEDVRCLQKYLNNSGYVITASGTGSKGNETIKFGGMTKKALIKWQLSNNLLPATGYFGPASRLQYEKLTSVVKPVIKPIEVIKPVELTASVSNVLPVKTTTIKNAETAMLKALTEIENAQDEIEDSNLDSNKLDNAREELDDALSSFYKAIRAFINSDYTKVVSLSDDAYESAIDAYKDAGGETDEDKVDELINAVDEEIDKVKEKIRVADRDGKDVEESDKLLDEARNILDDAEKKLDDNKYDDAKDLAKDARNKAEDSEDAIGEKSNDKEDAEDAIADAKTAINDARAKIQKAKDRNDDTDKAEDLVDEAKTLYNNARTKFDDENYSKAESLAKDAEQKAEDAIDEL